MAWPLKIKNVIREPIPATGSASKRVGNKTGLVWKIPGTSNKSVSLKVMAGFQGNKNNTISIQIFRGSSLDNAEKEKTFQAKTKFTKDITLPAEPGMVLVKIHTVKVGGMFGGFFEKFWGGAPGVSGRVQVKINTRTSNPASVGNGGGTTTPAGAGASGPDFSDLAIGGGLVLAALLFTR